MVIGAPNLNLEKFSTFLEPKDDMKVKKKKKKKTQNDQILKNIINYDVYNPILESSSKAMHSDQTY